MLEENKSITLYSQEGSSDKVYQLQLHPVEGGYGLTYANGRRGASLKPKPKTTSPLSLEAAHKEFDKVVNSKKKSRSRYVEELSHNDTLVVSEDASKDSGLRPQLLNEIKEAEAIDLCNDPLWVAQEKHDGERRPLIISAGNVQGTNRRGDFTGGMKYSVLSGIDTNVDMVLDTEDLGDHLVAFDILSYKGKDITSWPYIERYYTLVEALTHHKAIKLSPLAMTSDSKHELLSRMKVQNKEGVVFKRSDSPYTAGRPNKGGDQLKFKLYDECSVIVHKVNLKRSVQMAVFNSQNEPVFIGNVTIPANQPIPQVGDIIEVRYLYAYRDGSLYQPIFEKARPDLIPSDCVQTQLKYKPESSLAA